MLNILFYPHDGSPRPCFGVVPQRVNAERDAALAERAWAKKQAEADAKAVIDEQVQQHKLDKVARKAYVCG